MAEAAERILFPTDFSEVSLSALDTALLFAQRFDARITLLSVLEELPLPSLSYEHLPSFAPESFYEETERRSRTTLNEILEHRIPAPHRGQALIRRGVPNLEIVRVAEEEGFDLIVICTHGHTGLRHAFLGSVTEKVVRQAPCPVLTVRAGVEEE